MHWRRRYYNTTILKKRDPLPLGTAGLGIWRSPCDPWVKVWRALTPISSVRLTNVSRDKAYGRMVWCWEASGNNGIVSGTRSIHRLPREVIKGRRSLVHPLPFVWFGIFPVAAVKRIYFSVNFPFCAKKTTFVVIAVVVVANINVTERHWAVTDNCWLSCLQFTRSL